MQILFPRQRKQVRSLDTPEVSSLLITAFCTIPFGVVVAFLFTAEKALDSIELAMLTVFWGGISMVLCALSFLGVYAGLLAVIGFAVYAMGVTLAIYDVTSVRQLLWPLCAAIVTPIGILSGSILVLRVFGVQQKQNREFISIPLEDITDALDAVVVRLSPDGMICALSMNGEDHFGVARQMMVGTSFLDRVDVSDRVRYLGFLADLRMPKLKKNRRVSTEIRLRLVNNRADVPLITYRPYQLDAVAQMKNGEINDITVIARDISHEQDMRDHLQHALEDAKWAKKSKNQFLASVSHALRTPLNSIIRFSDMLLQEMQLCFENEKQREYVDLIHLSGKHLLSVANATLEMSRIKARSYRLSPQPFAFSEAADMCVGMMRHQATQKGVAIYNRVTDIAVEKGTSMLLFSVPDTGIGIAENEIAYLDQHFIQLKHAQTGTHEGVGLSLVTGLVELQGGIMDIHSPFDKGTIVTIHLESDNLEDNHTLKEIDGKSAMVVDLHPQAERHHDTQKKDEQDKEEGHTQSRKTA